MNTPEQNRSPSRARPYTLTAVASAGETGWPTGDARTTIGVLCVDRPSIAEISAYAGLPIGVVRVLVGDLVESGHLRVHNTLTDRSTATERRRLIERTLSGLRAL